ncbi:MAG TPA: M48 family metallopeptidase [Caulobacter sp.]|nr:M48 family metallopeptidase [Caulobacter sp.]
MGPVGLYTHIQANNFRSALLLLGFPVLLTGLVWALTVGLLGAGFLPSTGSVPGDLARATRLLVVSLPLAVVVSLVWFAIAYFANQTIIDLATGARPVQREDEPELYNLLENLAISRGMTTPTLRIIESDALNAYATGLHEKQYSITVTRGLMQALDRGELEAVLAHELTHVINRDCRTMVIAAVFAGIITLLAEVMFRAMRFGAIGSRAGRNKGAGLLLLIAFAAGAIGYLLAIVIRLALSRSREFVADAGSVELTKNPDAMISALRKISGRAHIAAPDSVRAMFLDDGKADTMDLFATHPPIEKRIEALVRYAGGRDMPVRDPADASGPWG